MFGSVWWIILLLPIAFAIGLYVGRLRQTKVSIGRWDGLTRLANSTASRLNDVRNERDQLDRELEATENKLASVRGELDASETEAVRIADLHQKAIAVVAGLEGDLGAAQARIEDFESDLLAANSRLRELEAALLIASVRVADFDTEAAPRPDLDEGRTELGRNPRMSADLSEMDDPATPAGAMSASTDVDSNRYVHTEALGTQGQDRLDNLQAINGIGPKMEQLLNSVGIRTWEQVSALNETEAANVDRTLSLHGRMERDGWVDQARALIADSGQGIVGTA